MALHRYIFNSFIVKGARISKDHFEFARLIDWWWNRLTGKSMNGKKEFTNKKKDIIDDTRWWISTLLKKKKKKESKSIYFVLPNLKIQNRIKRQYRVKESKCKVKILDKEEVSFCVEVLQHIIMLRLNMLTKPHPLTI